MEFVPKACGAVSGTARFAEKPSLDLSSFSTTGETQVDVVTIDNWCRERLVRPNFIKIDAEGFDFTVIKGAHKTLAETRPIVMFEANTQAHFGPIAEEMRSLGYSVAQFRANGSLCEPWVESATRNFVCGPASWPITDQFAL